MIQQQIFAAKDAKARALTVLTRAAKSGNLASVKFFFDGENAQIGVCARVSGALLGRATISAVTPSAEILPVGVVIVLGDLLTIEFESFSSDTGTNAQRTAYFLTVFWEII